MTTWTSHTPTGGRGLQKQEEDGHAEQGEHAHHAERLLRAHIRGQQLHHHAHRDPLEDVDEQPKERDDAGSSMEGNSEEGGFTRIFTGGF